MVDLLITDCFCQNTMSRVPRWFNNPYLEASDGSTTEVDNTSRLKEEALGYANKVFQNCIDPDGGLYVGNVGCTYMYLHMSHILNDQEKAQLLPLALATFDKSMEHYRVQSSGRSSPIWTSKFLFSFIQRGFFTNSDSVSFILGKAGVVAVGAVLARNLGNDALQNQCVSEYVNAAKICKPINFFRHGSDEIFVGRAGYLCGALWLQQKIGYQPVPRQDLKDIWNAIIESGTQYAIKNHSPCPLMYSYYNTEYLGAAHGLCAILQMLISFPGFLTENPSAAELIKNSIDYYLTLQDPLGNWPCAMDEVGPGRSRSQIDILLHWCHGAPGAIYLFAKAYLYYKEDKYLDACRRACDSIWKRGLLRKGPGLCHGVTGNGYAFLLLYKLSNYQDATALMRAKKFAEFLNHPQFVQGARTPDSPYSLFEGLAGAVCYLADVSNPAKAELFPFFNIYTNYE